MSAQGDLLLKAVGKGPIRLKHELVTPPIISPSGSSVYWLNVPYSQKDAAKSLGARWNQQKKRWYAPSMESMERLKRWA